MKAWGAEVATICSTKNVTLAHHLGADKVIDYTAGDFTTVLKNYDVVLDTIGRKYESKSLSVLKCLVGQSMRVSSLPRCSSSASLETSSGTYFSLGSIA